MVKKNCDDMLTVFIQYQRVTNGQTDGQTDKIGISISRVSALTRDNNKTETVVSFRGLRP